MNGRNRVSSRGGTALLVLVAPQGSRHGRNVSGGNGSYTGRPRLELGRFVPYVCELAGKRPNPKQARGRSRSSDRLGGHAATRRGRRLWHLSTPPARLSLHFAQPPRLHLVD